MPHPNNPHRALFLDRDGVINIDNPNYTWQKEAFVFTDFIFDITRAATALDYKIVIITNQGGIAKGLYGHQEVALLHQQMLADFAKQGVTVSRILYSPHHPVYTRSLSRKPESLLFERACALENISAPDSWMIGDRCRDLIPAKKLGIRTILLGDETCEAAEYRFSSAPKAEKIIALINS